MRIVRSPLLVLGASLLLLTLAGCGMSQEDKDFYLGGWVRPTDLDKPSPAAVRRQQALSDSSSMAQYGSAPQSASQPATAHEPIPAIEYQ